MPLSIKAIKEKLFLVSAKNEDLNTGGGVMSPALLWNIFPGSIMNNVTNSSRGNAEQFGQCHNHDAFSPQSSDFQHNLVRQFKEAILGVINRAKTFPRITSDCLLGVTSGNSELSGNFFNRDFGFTEKAAHFQNSSSRQFVPRMIFAARTVLKHGQRMLRALRLPVLVNLVLHVVKTSAKKQMTLCVTTLRVIASVETLKTIGNWPVVKFVSESVRGGVVPIDVSCPVTVSGPSPQPKPARSKFWVAWWNRSILINSLPENLWRHLWFPHKRKTPTAFESKSANESGIKDSGCKSLFSFIGDALNASHGQPQLSTF